MGKKGALREGRGAKKGTEARDEEEGGDRAMA